jgi:hypothetical protein
MVKLLSAELLAVLRLLKPLDASHTAQSRTKLRVSKLCNDQQFHGGSHFVSSLCTVRSENAVSAASRHQNGAYALAYQTNILCDVKHAANSRHSACRSPIARWQHVLRLAPAYLADLRVAATYTKPLALGRSNHFRADAMACLHGSRTASDRIVYRASFTAYSHWLPFAKFLGATARHYTKSNHSL